MRQGDDKGGKALMQANIEARHCEFHLGKKGKLAVGRPERQQKRNENHA